MKEWNKCPACLMTTRGGPDYCPNCGEPWTIKCSQCGLTWRFWESHKFCPNCGASVERRGISRVKKRQVATQVGHSETIL